MNRLILFLVFVGVASAFDKEKIFKKYATMKIYEECFGESNVKRFMHKFEDALGQCMDLKDHDNREEDRNGWGDSDGWGKRNPYSRPYHPAYYQPYFYGRPHDRSKRGAFEEIITKKKQMFEKKIKMMCCAMKKMGFMNDNESPNFNKIRESIEENAPNSKIREKMIDNMEICRDIALCVPEKKFKDIPFIKNENQGRTYVFMKCFEKQKLHSCIKCGLTKQMKEFDVDLEEIFDNEYED